MRYQAGTSTFSLCVHQQPYLLRYQDAQQPNRMLSGFVRPFFGHHWKEFAAVFNPLISYSPRIAAMVANKPFGEDHIRKPEVLHRIALRQANNQKAADSAATAPAEALREQTA